jgi:hypothetical protein
METETQTSTPDWITKRRAALEAQLKQAKEWARPPGSGVVGASWLNTEAARMLLAAHTQLLETLLEGEPKTQLPPRHHP